MSDEAREARAAARDKIRQEADAARNITAGPGVNMLSKNFDRQLGGPRIPYHAARALSGACVVCGSV